MPSGLAANLSVERIQLRERAFVLDDVDRRELAWILREGSKSFDSAARLLPARLRDAVLVYYAYCRRADDEVDESGDPAGALLRLQDELEGIFSGSTSVQQDRVTRNLTRLVHEQGLSRAPFDGLLEGFAWDAQRRQYETLADLESYCARVASTVGITMTQLMGPRCPHMWARAADLGVAMQLTNIARDVGTDARAGRIYLPTSWLDEASILSTQLLAQRESSPVFGMMVHRLLVRADELYLRSEAGILALPRDCRRAIYAARLIYADIGRSLARQGYDAITRRAYVKRSRKIWLLVRARFTLPRPQASLDLAALPATKWLCRAD